MYAMVTTWFWFCTARIASAISSLQSQVIQEVLYNTIVPTPAVLTKRLDKRRTVRSTIDIFILGHDHITCIIHAIIGLTLELSKVHFHTKIIFMTHRQHLKAVQNYFVDYAFAFIWKEIIFSNTEIIKRVCLWSLNDILNR